MKKSTAKFAAYGIVAVAAAGLIAFLSRRPAAVADESPPPIVGSITLANGQTITPDRAESERLGNLSEAEFRAEIEAYKREHGLTPPPSLRETLRPAMEAIGAAATALGLFSGPTQSRVLTDPTLNAPRPVAAPPPVAPVLTSSAIPLADKAAEEAFTTEYDPLILEAANNHGIPAPLLKATLIAESGLNPKAVSATGARGIAQFFPAAWKDVYGEQAALRDRENPADAIPAAAAYLSMLRRTYGEQYGITNWETALQAYNAGLLHTKEGSVPPEAVAYQQKIFSLAGDVGD